jgi:hypothetical protein
MKTFFCFVQNEYLILADQLSVYAVKLLDKVRGHKELDCVLGKTGKESEEKYLLLARLYLAIKYEEKPVSEIWFKVFLQDYGLIETIQ